MQLRPILVAFLLSLFLAWSCLYLVVVEAPNQLTPPERSNPSSPLSVISGTGSWSESKCSKYRQRAVASEQEELNDFYYGQQAGRWLDAYVIPDAHLIFCQIHKVGSTKWLRLLRWLDGQDYNAFPHLWYGDKPGNLTTLRHLGRKRALEMMFDPNWTKIVAIRDPLDRLRSAYFSKVARSSPLSPESAAVFARELNVSIEGLLTLSFLGDRRVL